MADRVMVMSCAHLFRAVQFIERLRFELITGLALRCSGSQTLGAKHLKARRWCGAWSAIVIEICLQRSRAVVLKGVFYFCEQFRVVSLRGGNLAAEGLVVQAKPDRSVPKIAGTRVCLLTTG